VVNESAQTSRGQGSGRRQQLPKVGWSLISTIKEISLYLVYLVAREGFLSGVAFGLEAIDATHTDAGSHHGGRAELRPGVHVCPQPFMI
jgi:hypothetical protein